MLNKELHEKCKSLLDKLYGQCSYPQYVVAIDFAIRTCSKIFKHGSIFHYINSNLPATNFDSMLILKICEYYLDGNGEKRNLNEDIFPIINALSGNKESLIADDLKQLFLNEV